ncbi:MAG: CocE/NonD family hydrolase [Kiritimatiellae bacterium]|nr:CocE/NonD family hydrolase [Kiritimatiellia bacterium]
MTTIPNKLHATLALALALPLAGAASAVFFNDVKIPMRDGVNLAGDLYLPTNRAEKIGCFMSFSPYKATGGEKPYCPERAEEWGVATLAVDCRGCCHSEGVFEPWEGRLVDDADDLLKWIAAQPWSNGRVVTVGGSYPGNTQLACLKSGNPALVACAPSVITVNPHSILYAPGGVLIPEFFQKWHSGLSSSESWEELTRHPDRNDPYWASRCGLRNLSSAKGRALYQAGWFDMLGVETFESFALMPEGSFLRVGPWSHGVNTFDRPEIDYSKVEGTSVTEDMEIEFLRSALEGRASETAKLPGRIQIFVMGANVWRYENEWPLKRTVYRKLCFDEGLSLAFDAPRGAAGEDSFAYDPENPVPTKGGRVIHAGGQYSQAEIEARKDVLSYTTKTLDGDLEVTGVVRASIVAKSSARVADVAVKLVDVYPDGTPYNVLDSICRGEFAAETATKLDFRVDITSYVFKKGHKVRVEIAGSNFPHYDKAKEAATTRLVRGESHLVLPTIPGAVE